MGRRAAALYPPTTSSPTASAAGYAVGQAGQRHEAGLGLYDYHARYYDPLIGRLVSADTIVPSPGDPQSLNRYAYVQNNPLKYTDPSGHALWAGEDIAQEFDLYTANPMGRGWNAHDTEVVAWTAGTLFVGAGAEALVATGAAADAASAVSWKTLEWVLGRPALARILGVGGSAATRELTDGDDDEVRAVEALRARATLGTMGPRSDPAIQMAEESLTKGINPAPSGYYDVLSHGTSYRMMGPQGQIWNARQVSEWILRQPDYTPGQPVRLVTCWTGRNANGLAQGVANELATSVLGSTTRVSAATLRPLRVDQLGAVVTYGIWRLFTP